jgi:hypothetical protein
MARIKNNNYLTKIIKLLMKVIFLCNKNNKRNINN